VKAHTKKAKDIESALRETRSFAGIFADIVDDQGESVFADVVCRRAR
jgi:hypothetical protein